jgi:hypothetical protein
MVYRVVADVVMAVHFGFLVYLALGGFLAWRRPRLLIPHAAAVAWGALSVSTGVDCPLTGWEDWARRRAGEEGLSRGFIDTYLTGVVYPEENLVLAQLLVAVLVTVSWAGAAVIAHRARRGASPAAR